MKNLLLLALLLISTVAVASDYHQSDSTHRIAYVVTDFSGNPVTGQTVRVGIQRASDGYFYDFNDSTFKASGWTTRLSTLTYETTGEYYYKNITIDNGGIVSGDYVCIVSNDDATYGDQQAEVINFDNVAKLIKIHR